MRYYGDYAEISMENIHLCSDNGESTSYLITSAQVIIKTNEITKFDKNDVRLAGW